ncbi:MAG: hypothetical protein GF384_03085, partial [Elusimicrobia bacterium]|nr:hypothetical protein [Elusimicrobiota bacterium]
MKKSLLVHVWIQIIICFISASILLSLLWWGLFSTKKAQLLTGNFSRGSMDSMYDKHSQYNDWFLITGDNDTKQLESDRDDGLNHKAVKVFTYKQKKYGLPAFVYGSSSVDERKAARPLFFMLTKKPSLNPHEYLYGGSFLYPAAFILIGMKTVGLIDPHSDVYFPFTRSPRIAAIYIPGRMLNIVSYIAILIILGYWGMQIKGPLCSVLSMLIWLLSSLPFHHALTSKPHLYAALWIFLSAYILVKMINHNTKGILLASLILGLGVGASIITVVFILVFYWMIITSTIKNKLLWMVLSSFCCVIVFLVTNPYILVFFNRFLQTILFCGFHAGVDHTGYA